MSCDACEPARIERRKATRLDLVRWGGYLDVINGTLAMLRMLGRDCSALSFHASLSELNHQRAFAEQNCDRLRGELEALGG